MSSSDDTRPDPSAISTSLDPAFSSEPPEASVPQSDPAAQCIDLTIRAVKPFTEIRVLDARFEPVSLPANTGSVKITVSPGLYEIGFRCGDTWHSQHVIAEPGSLPIMVEQQSEPEQVTCPSVSTALGETLPLEQASVVVTLQTGDPQAASLGGVSVTLVQAEGVDATTPNLTPQGDGTWCFPASPGLWRLRINETAARQPFEIAITIVPDYLVHVSAPLLADGPELRVNLDKMRIRLLSRGHSTAIDPQLLGFEDAALLALSTGRQMFGQAVEELIDDLAGEKASNPMLGILAAHLCDRGGDEDVTFRETLLGRLERLTGGPWAHPDVAILRLAFLSRYGQLTGNEPPVRFPPILAASWRLLIDLARDQPRLIPPGSLCERVADRLWSSTLWTAWTAPPIGQESVPAADTSLQPDVGRTRVAVLFGATRTATPEPPVIVGERIVELLSYPELREWLRGAAGSHSAGTDGLAWDTESVVTPAEVAIATALYPVAGSEEHQSLYLDLSDKWDTQRAKREAHNPTAMADQLGLPRSTVERALTSLVGKLDLQADTFNIKS